MLGPGFTVTNQARNGRFLSRDGWTGRFKAPRHIPATAINTAVVVCACGRSWTPILKSGSCPGCGSFARPQEKSEAAPDVSHAALPNAAPSPTVPSATEFEVAYCRPPSGLSRALRHPAYPLCIGLGQFNDSRIDGRVAAMRAVMLAMTKEEWAEDYRLLADSPEAVSVTIGGKPVCTVAFDRGLGEAGLEAVRKMLSMEAARTALSA